MTMRDAERQAFEAWCERPIVNMPTDTENDGSYAYSQTGDAWTGWQGRAAVRPIPALPDWNDLPQDLRSELVRKGEFYDPDWGGDCALAVYSALKDGLPEPEPEVFPLFNPAALSTPEPVSVPVGWRLVPVEITDEQADAIRKAWRDTRVSGVCGMSIDAQWRSEFAREIAMYRATLAAAPPPPVSAAPVSGEETSGDLRLMGYAPIDPDTGVSSVPDAMYTLQCTITATKGTAADAYRRRAFKSLEKSISALSPSPEGVNAVEMVRAIRASTYRNEDGTPAQAALNILAGSEDGGDEFKRQMWFARAILSHLGIPDTSTDGK